MKGSKLILAAGIVTLYVALPAYRYYALGAWIGYRVLSHHQKYTVVRKRPIMSEGVSKWK